MQKNNNTQQDHYCKAVRIAYFTAYLYLLKEKLPEKKFLTRFDLIQRLSEILNLEDESILSFLEGDLATTRNAELWGRLFIFANRYPIEIVKSPRNTITAASEFIEKELVDRHTLRQATDGVRKKKLIEQLIREFLIDRNAFIILRELCPVSTDFWVRQLRLLISRPDYLYLNKTLVTQSKIEAN